MYPGLREAPPTAFLVGLCRVKTSLMAYIVVKGAGTIQTLTLRPLSAIRLLFADRVDKDLSLQDMQPDLGSTQSELQAHIS